MNDERVVDRWAQLRFAIIGPLLAAPPATGQLKASLELLARKTWAHPINGTAFTTVQAPWNASTTGPVMRRAGLSASPAATL